MNLWVELTIQIIIENIPFSPLDRVWDRIFSLYTMGTSRVQFGYSYAETEFWFWEILDVKYCIFSFSPCIFIQRIEEGAGLNT